MNGKKKLALASTVLITVITLSFFAGYYAQSLLPVQQDIKHPHSATLMIRRNGAVIYNYTTHNIITTIGSTYCRDILGFNNITTQNATKWISLSDDATPLKSWTKLPGEFTTGGLERTLATMSVINSTAYQAYNSWTATASNTVRCTGLQYASETGSDNNLWAVATVPDASVISGDDVEMTWKVNTPDG